LHFFRVSRNNYDPNSSPMNLGMGNDSCNGSKHSG
jgi:hypothetical protein